MLIKLPVISAQNRPSTLSNAFHTYRFLWRPKKNLVFRKSLWPRPAVNLLKSLLPDWRTAVPRGVFVSLARSSSRWVGSTMVGCTVQRHVALTFATLLGHHLGPDSWRKKPIVQVRVSVLFCPEIETLSHFPFFKSSTLRELTNNNH